VYLFLLSKNGICYKYNDIFVLEHSVMLMWIDS